MSAGGNPVDPKNPPNEWMSLNAAAKHLDMTRQGVLQLVVKGVLEGTHVAGRTVIRRATVERLLQETEAA